MPLPILQLHAACSTFSALFLPLPVSQLCHITCSYSKCSISVTACIELLSHYCQYTTPFLILPVFQCSVPATSCITALMPLHHLQFSVLLLPLPVSQLCLFTPASSVCYSCHCLYHSNAPLHVQFSAPFLLLSVHQLCPLTAR